MVDDIPNAGVEHSNDGGISYSSNDTGAALIPRGVFRIEGVAHLYGLSIEPGAGFLNDKLHWLPPYHSYFSL